MSRYADLLAEGRRLLPEPRYPRFEADELLARAAGRPRSWFLSRRHEEAPEDEATRYRELVSRRLAGEPLQYLLGEWEFCGRTFRSDSRALIPRGETEAIVEIARTVAPDAVRILDAGTGTGVLAVTLALERPEARVVASDVSLDALALARENVRLHGVEGRVRLLGSSWMRALAPVERFDLAVSNPPYVPLADAPWLSRTVSEHEPHVALYGGDDGLDPLRLLLAELPPLLARGAAFIFEIGYGQARGVSEAVDASAGFRLESIRLDAAGIPRTATAIRV